MTESPFIHNTERNPSRTVSAVVLSAGGSTRMATPKALLELWGAPLIHHHLLRLSAFASSICVVLGAESDRISAALPPGVHIVHNPSWAHSHPADSLRLALLAHPSIGPCIVTPVDTPPAHPDTLAALLGAQGSAVPTAPDGQDGHPVVLDRALQDEVRRAAPTGGLRTLLRDAVRVPVSDPLVGWDFDHPEAWQRFLVRVKRPAPAR